MANNAHHVVVVTPDASRSAPGPAMQHAARASHGGLGTVDRSVAFGHHPHPACTVEVFRRA
jgi:hypothetical protein